MHTSDFPNSIAVKAEGLLPGDTIVAYGGTLAGGSWFSWTKQVFNRLDNEGRVWGYYPSQPARAEHCEGIRTGWFLVIRQTRAIPGAGEYSL